MADQGITLECKGDQQQHRCPANETRQTEEDETIFKAKRSHLLYCKTVSLIVMCVFNDGWSTRMVPVVTTDC